MTARVRRVGRAAQGKGALLTLAVLFFLSGALRLIDGAATAASDGAMTEKPDMQATEEPARPKPTTPADDHIDAATLSAAMAELRAREERLIAAEAAMADRRRALEIAETTVDRKLAELVAAEERLSATMSRSAAAAEDDIARLTSVYENMKPKEATEVFARMEPDFAAGFLARMRPDAAASILSGLEPDKAYSISVILAGRNANAPRE
ncbi:MAG: hypothetical protein AAF566_13345 [Pseudomonadota bacterium]